VSLDATFAALADPTRRGVVDLLRRGPHRAGELSDALATSPPALSRHLRVLRECGLVEEERDPDDARARVLRLRAAPFEELRRWVDEVERFWEGQLAAFRDHAESRRRDRPEGRRPRARPSRPGGRR
jgi:DNA-binding transcriptional ArsR family regulator